MQAHRLYKPGMRTVKTILSVGLCLLIAQLTPGVGQGLFSGVAAIVCMQPTTEESFRLGVHRMIGTVIGGLFGFLTLLGYDYAPPWLFSWSSWAIIPLVMFVVICLCNIIHEAESSAIGCIVVLAIAYDASIGASGAFSVALRRVVETLIGIVVALLVNRFIAPPPKSKPKVDTPSPVPPKRNDKETDAHEHDS